MGQYVIACISALLIICLLSAAGGEVTPLPRVQLPLGPPAIKPPYDDDRFFERANNTIHQICDGDTLPVGKMNMAFHDSLAGTYYTLIRMNISQKEYPRAEELISFLSYTLTLTEKYLEYESEKNTFSPVDTGRVSYEDLTPWYDAAAGIWKNMYKQYPGTKMYGMPDPVPPKTWIIGEIP